MVPGLDGRVLRRWIVICTMLAAPLALAAPEGDGFAIFGIPFEFLLFAATLLGVALFHHQVLRVALTGLAVISLYKILVAGFKTGSGLDGFGAHMGHE